MNQGSRSIDAASSATSRIRPRSLCQWHSLAHNVCDVCTSIAEQLKRSGRGIAHGSVFHFGIKFGAD
jgi:hypothetical protein